MESTQDGSKFSWMKAIRDAKLSGFSAMLATHSEVRGFDASIPHLDLEVHVSMKNYLRSKAAQDLLEKMQTVLGASLSISWSTGTAVNSPAIKTRLRRSDRMIAAIESIKRDVFFDVISSEMGGKVVIQSIAYDGD